MPHIFSLVRNAGVVALCLTAGVSAQKFTSPDAPATERAAQEALTRAKILDIVGVARDVSSLVRDLDGRMTEFGIEIDVPADVLFDFDKHELRPEAVGQLSKIGALIGEHKGAPIEVTGHTDGRGSDAHNVPLSLRRANSVKAWLVANGRVPAEQITTFGFGKVKPIAPNTKPDGSDDPDGRQKNRRVQILIRTKAK